MVIRVCSSDDMHEFVRVTQAAFGEAASEPVAGAIRSLLDPGRCYLVDIDGEPAAGAASFALDLTLPGGVTVPVAAVSEVGVHPTHRRRGIARELLSTQLRDVADQGAAAAVLHASEAPIYGNFGYGVATRRRHIEARARQIRWREDRPRARGRCRIVSPDRAKELLPRVQDAAAGSVVGGLTRPLPWWEVILGDAELYLGGGKGRLFMVHEDDDGVADGYAIYQVSEAWDGLASAHRMTVWEVLGVAPDVELALWETLMSHDLVAVVDADVAVDHVLFDAVEDPRRLRYDWGQDLLWLRPLDVEALLGRRSMYGSDGLTLEVIDPLGIASGRFDVSANDGTGRCRTSSSDPDLVLGVGELGSLVLGGGSARRAVRAGRIDEVRAGAAHRLDSMLAVDPLPWCWVRF